MNLSDFRAFTQRIQRHVQDDENVLGLVMCGSSADNQRTPDHWSDHDFFLITHPDQQEHYRQDLSWLPDADQVVLKIRETAHGLKVLYAYGHLIEFAVFDVDELKMAKLNDYRVLIDKERITERAQELVTEPAQIADYDPIRDASMVIALIYVGCGRIARGEGLSAHVFLKHHVLHHLLPLLDHILGSTHSDKRDTLDIFRRFEQVHPEIGARLNKCLLLPVPECGLALLDLLDDVVKPNVSDYPSEAIAVVRTYVENIRNQSDA